MSEYAFKNLNEIDMVEDPVDGTTMMGFQNGVPIQMPMSAVKSGGGGVFIIDPSSPEYDLDNPAYGDQIKEALLAGKVVLFYYSFATAYVPILYFRLKDNSGTIYLDLFPLMYEYNSSGVHNLRFNVSSSGSGEYSDYKQFRVSAY